jgi:light-regulated signal transduction histidine kinase (bacteriophytochrome)
MTTADSVQSAASATVTLLREFTGYDRIFIYRFDPQWNGEVIAESVRSDMNVFLNLRFPASDIPPPGPQTLQAKSVSHRLRHPLGSGSADWQVRVPL